ncbi:MAG: DNA-binding CsgD family transcriptional regulator [Planctomycetaceae bacterium]|jgi:DNA-binding CsgD family transcriptional regulator
MSRDKLVDYERRSVAAKRPTHTDTLTDKGGLTPSTIVSQREEWNAVSDGLSETEKRILKLTGDGHSTEEVASLIEGRSGRSIRRFLKQLRESFWK